MVKAHSYNIKLLISIHSYNALDASADFYGKWYGTGNFYTSSEAQGYFKERIAHVLAHVNPATGKTWAKSSEYIFAFEAQNEAMHPQVCLLSSPFEEVAPEVFRNATSPTTAGLRGGVFVVKLLGAPTVHQ